MASLGLSWGTDNKKDEVIDDCDEQVCFKFSWVEKGKYNLDSRVEYHVGT